MSATVRMVKSFYDVSVQDLILTGVFIIALAASVTLGILGRQYGQANPGPTSSEIAAAQTEQGAGTPFPTENGQNPSPTPPAPAPNPAPQPQASAKIPNAGPGETAAVLFIGTSAFGYLAYSAYLRRQPIKFG